MRHLQRILDALGSRLGEPVGQRAVVLQHRPTGRYLGAGAQLVHQPGAALVFESQESADALAGRFACEPGSFTAVEAPAVPSAA